MKFLIILLISFVYTLGVSAQLVPEEVAPYKKDRRIPDFTIIQPDSTWFTKSQLPKHTHTVIIYFAPDCSHCQYEATELVNKMDSLKNVFFVFVAYKGLDEIREFALKYKLDKYPNIRYGRDPKYYIPSFYRVQFTPFVAVYDRRGMFLREYLKGVEASELVALLRKN